jgi:hypothetical protein
LIKIYPPLNNVFDGWRAAIGRRHGRGFGADSSTDPSSFIPDCLHQLTRLLQFPEEVAVLMADYEHSMFIRVPPVDYIRHVTSNMTSQFTLPVASQSRDGQTSRLQHQLTVNDLVVRFQQVSQSLRMRSF